MPIAFDAHTHTIMSGHAFSTIEENAAACARRGLSGCAITDHGPAMPASAQLIYFFNLANMPRDIGGVRVLRGVEANIVDYEGRLDVPDTLLKRLDICIASCHDIILPPRTSDDHTAAWLSVLRNPLIDIVGHSGRGPFPFDIETVLKACRAENKVIEINNHTIAGDAFPHNCREIAAACRDFGVQVIVDSDAHLSYEIGQVDAALEMLQSIGFPDEMIVNRSWESFRSWLLSRKPHLLL